MVAYSHLNLCWACGCWVWIIFRESLLRDLLRCIVVTWECRYWLGRNGYLLTQASSKSILHSAPHYWNPFLQSTFHLGVSSGQKYTTVNEKWRSCTMPSINRLSIKRILQCFQLHLCPSESLVYYRYAITTDDLQGFFVTRHKNRKQQKTWTLKM